MKITITLLLLVSSIAFTVLAMMSLAMIPPSCYREIWKMLHRKHIFLNLMYIFLYSVLYATVIIGSCANYAASPLFLELAVEMAFPVDETIVGGFMSCAYNLVGALFLFAFFIPDIGMIFPVLKLYDPNFKSNLQFTFFYWTFQE